MRNFDGVEDDCGLPSDWTAVSSVRSVATSDTIFKPCKTPPAMNHGKINWNEELKDEFGGGFVLRRESELDPPLIETVMNRDRFVSSGNLSAGSAGDAVVKGLS